MIDGGRMRATAAAGVRRLRWRLQPPVLALGGGGARGFAHIGVLRALDESGLSARAVVGTSMGAVIGAMYLAAGSADAVERLWRQAFEQELIAGGDEYRSPDDRRHEHPLIQAARRIRNRVVVSFAMNRPAMLSDRGIKRALQHLLPGERIEDLPRPFIAVATDLETGDEVRLAGGDLRSAVRASSAIPGILPAVEVDGRMLVDGGVLAEVPVAAACSLGGSVLAVDVSMDLPPLQADALALDTMMRTQLMTSQRLRRHQMRAVRWVIRPEVGHLTWSDWDRFEELIAIGYRAGVGFLSGDTPADELTPGA